MWPWQLWQLDANRLQPSTAYSQRTVYSGRRISDAPITNRRLTKNPELFVIVIHEVMSRYVTI